MKGVEDTQDIKLKNPFYLSNIWKPVFALLMIGIIILEGVTYFQNNSLAEISRLQDRLEEQLTQLAEENDRLLSWDRHIDRVQSFLTEVVQLDLTKYYAVLLTNTIEFRQDFDGIAEETLRYNLISNDSELDVDFRFRNQTLFRYRMNVIEGSPIYLNTKPVELSDYFSEILLNYRTYSGFSYFEQLKEMLNEANDLGAIETTRDNMKLVLSTEIDETEVRWFHTRAGINYQAKGVLFRFEDGILEEFTNGYNLYRIATTEINISEEEAKTLAEEYAKTVSWTDDGQKVSNFNILYELTEAELYPHPWETLDLVPYWFVTIKLDHIYPGNVNFIGIGLWADTGEINGYQLLTTA